MRTICLGEALIDFIALDAVPLPEATHYMRCLGGAAVNVAVGLQHFGVPVTLVSRVGRDKLGQQVLLELEQRGLSLEHVQVDQKWPTKCSFISHDKSGLRYIEIANRQSADQHIDAVQTQKALYDDFDVLYFSGVMLLKEQGLGLVMQCIRTAKEKEALVAFDPVLDVSRASEPVKERIVEVLAHTDILKVNDTEYEALSDALSDQRPSIILHTRGEDGATIRYLQSEVTIEAVDVIPVDPTGAGDAFLAGFLATMLKDGGDIDKEIVELGGETAALNASKIITEVGGNNAYHSGRLKV